MLRLAGKFSGLRFWLKEKSESNTGKGLFWVKRVILILEK